MVDPNTKVSRTLARAPLKKRVNLGLLVSQHLVTQRSRLVSRLSHGKLKSAVRNGHFPNNSRTELSTGRRFPLFGKHKTLNHILRAGETERKIFLLPTWPPCLFLFFKSRAMLRNTAGHPEKLCSATLIDRFFIFLMAF